MKDDIEPYTSQYSTDNGQCVAAGRQDGDVVVRDNKHPDGPVLRYTPAEWAAFMIGVKNGEFDQLAD